MSLHTAEHRRVTLFWIGRVCCLLFTGPAPWAKFRSPGRTEECDHVGIKIDKNIHKLDDENFQEIPRSPPSPSFICHCLAPFTGPRCLDGSCLDSCGLARWDRQNVASSDLQNSGCFESLKIMYFLNYTQNSPRPAPSSAPASPFLLPCFLLLFLSRPHCGAAALFLEYHAWSQKSTRN